MIIYLLIALILIYMVLYFTKKEGFESPIFKTFVNDIYDEFYTKIYDEVIHTIPYETQVIKLMKPYFNNNSNCLCIGSKTGHIVQLLSGMVNVTGVDKSYEMVKMSEYKYPNNRYVYGDYLASFLFQPNTFTHILCPLFSIYTTNPTTLFKNANTWLVDKGYLAVVYFKKDFNIYNIKNHFPSDYFKLKYKYSIELKNNKIIEKIKNSNKIRTNILYLNDVNLEENSKNQGFRKVSEQPIPELSETFLIIYQKF